MAVRWSLHTTSSLQKQLQIAWVVDSRVRGSAQRKDFMEKDTKRPDVALC